MTIRIPFFLTALSTLGCAGTAPAPLPADDHARLQQAADDPDSLGRLIYRGTVSPRSDAEEVLFRYERRVRQTDDGWQAHHLTWTPDGEPLILHSARYLEDGTLLDFEELHDQIGLTATLTQDGDGVWNFEGARPGFTFATTQAHDDPMHVGPTLFQYALEHWEELEAGETLPLRFAVLNDSKAYRFNLRLLEQTPEVTTFSMIASEFFVRLAVPPMEIHFATDSREPLQFNGLVPPMTGLPLSSLNAQVHYEMVAEQYE